MGAGNSPAWNGARIRSYSLGGTRPLKTSASVPRLMPLKIARTTTSSPPGCGTGSSRISPRPGSTIQKALASVTERLRHQVASFCHAVQFDWFFLTVVAVDLLPASLYAMKAAAVFAAVLVLVRAFVGRHHPFPTFGPANQVTMVRAALVALVAGLIGEPNVPAYATAAAVVSGLVTALDGLDGWLARRTRMASAFGARFDMEVDAVLILVLPILAWQYGKAGAWIILAGLMRYLFVAAGWLFPWMARPLFPSRRRQTVCVLQIVGSSILLLPVVTPPVSVWLAATLLGALSASFFVDVQWLWSTRRGENERTPDSATAWLALVASLILLNAAVTFHNIWPTPAVGWSGEVSVELAVVLLLGILGSRVIKLSSPGLGWTLAVLWLVLAIGRYVDVTAP